MHSVNWPIVSFVLYSAFASLCIIDYWMSRNIVVSQCIMSSLSVKMCKSRLMWCDSQSVSKGNFSTSPLIGTTNCNIGTYHEDAMNACHMLCYTFQSLLKPAKLKDELQMVASSWSLVCTILVGDLA